MEARVMIAGALLSLSLSTGLLIPVADNPPRFDIEASCKGVASAGGTPSACREDERKAQTALEAKWQAYRPANRNQCLEAAKLVGSPSYVQLLTCLELAANK
jgi:hypothetical protein